MAKTKTSAEAIDIRKVAIISQRAMDDNFPFKSECGVYEDFASRSFVLWMKSWLAAGYHKKVDIVIVEEVPTGLWQHVRQVVLPQFVLDRWPVKTRQIANTTYTTVYRVCPHREAPSADYQHYMWMGDKGKAI